MTEETVQLLIFLFAAVFFGIGLAGVLGFWKSWYWRSPRRVYPYIPLGVLFFAAAFDEQMKAALPGNEWIVTAVYVLIFAVVIWFVVATPRWLKPQWIRKIEDQPKNVYAEMARQAQANDDWREKVNDPQKLDAWIQEVRRKPPKGKKSG